MKCQPINKNLTWFNVNKMKIFVNIKSSVSNWVLNNANEKLKYTVITFCYISCFSHSLDGRSYSVTTIYLTIFYFFFICSCSQVFRKDSDSFTQKNIFTSLPFLLQRNCLRCLEGFFVASKEIFYHHSLFPNCSFSQISRRNGLILQYLFFLTWYMPDVLERFYQFTNFLLFCMLFRVLAKHLLHSQVPHFYFSNSFIEIKHLPCYIFILFHLPQIPRKNHVTSPQ